MRPAVAAAFRYRRRPPPWRLLPARGADWVAMARSSDDPVDIMLEIFTGFARRLTIGWPRGNAVQPGGCGAMGWDHPDWDEVEFRRGLKPGDRVDVMDLCGAWREAEIDGTPVELTEYGVAHQEWLAEHDE